MERTFDTAEDYETTLKSWMVEFTVKVDEDSHRHLTMIMATDISTVHHQLLRELRKEYQDSARVDVTVHRIEPVTTNTDALLIELISVLRDKQMGVNVYTDTGEQVQSRFEQYRAEEEERADRDYGAI